MRETNFINQNKDKWLSFEKKLTDDTPDAKKIKEIFVETTDDLSFARTFYGNRSVRVYLNGLAQRIFSKLYKNKKSKRGRLTSFYKTELPLLLYDARFELRLGLGIFLIAVLIGVISCYADNDFLSIVINEQYVEMTRANIEKGDPMAVYKDDSFFGSFLGITANNIWVSFITFIFGVTYIGTIGIMIKNGVMLGAFQYFFVDYGLFRESFLTVWMHGVLEISAIVIAGAAGLTLGKGLVFPGTLSRARAFGISARRGVKMMLGVVPMLVVAGFIEAYLTRYTEMPDILRALFILGCFGFVFFYYYWYPKKVATDVANTKTDTDELLPDSNHQIDFTSVLSNSDIFHGIFAVFRKHSGSIMGICSLLSLIYCAVVFIGSSYQPSEMFAFFSTQLNAISPLQALFAALGGSSLWTAGQFFYQSKSLLPIFGMGICFTILGYLIHKKLKKEANIDVQSPIEATASRKPSLLFLLNNAITVAAILFLFFLGNLSAWLFWIAGTLLIPILFIALFINSWEGKNAFWSIGNAFSLIGDQYGKAIVLFFILMITGVSFYLLLDTVFTYFIVDFVSINFVMKPEMMENFAAYMLTYLAVFVIMMITSVFLLGYGILYFSLIESKEAIHLIGRITQIDVQRRIKGLKRE